MIAEGDQRRNDVGSGFEQEDLAIGRGQRAGRNHEVNAALIGEKDTRTPAQLKMDSQLLYALKQSRGQTMAPGVPTLQFLPSAETNGLFNGLFKVDIDATVSSNLLAAITQAGGIIENSVPQFDAIRAGIPLPLAEQLAGRPDVRFVRVADKGHTHTGSVDSEGDITQTADLARAAFGVDGAGVKVGVLSDSVDHLAQSQATGDLPTDLTVLPGQSGVPGTGEGSAMAAQERAKTNDHANDC